MTTLVKLYFEELAEGRLPAEESEESKAYKAWSWAYEQVRKIKVSVAWEIGREAEAFEEEMGQMYR